jgi:hypothetical protein
MLNLANVYKSQGCYNKAETLYNEAETQYSEDEYSEAETLYKQVLAGKEIKFDMEHTTQRLHEGMLVVAGQEWITQMYSRHLQKFQSPDS